jgi:hypothetical protein
MLSTTKIILGAILLLLGRKLFWFFVGVIGFLTGALLAAHYLRGQSEWVILGIGLVAGVLGALLAGLVERLSVEVVGFLGGGYIALDLLNLFKLGNGQFAWLPFLVGGLIGALLVAVLLDWALILISSLEGALLITQSIQISISSIDLVFVVLFLIGMVVQIVTLTRKPRKPVQPKTNPS